MVKEREDGGLGVGSWMVMVRGDSDEVEGLGKGNVYVLMPPVCGGMEEEEAGEEEAADDRMACRRIFHRACALLGWGGRTVIMM